MASRVIYKCAVDGNLGWVKHGRRTLTAICPKIRVGGDSICGAHGNKKCKHKSREVKSE